MIAYREDAAVIAARARQSHARPSALRIVWALPALLLWIGVMLVVYALAVLARRPVRGVIRCFHRGVLRVLNIRVELLGAMAPQSDDSTHYLCVSNHVSYIDVFVLGSVLDGAFVAKAEVAHWPLLGKLARLQDTLFFERNARRASQQVAQLQRWLQQRNIVFFPEGTSTPGAHVEPFRSSLFAAAQSRPIQAFTIAYTHYDGVPMRQSERDRYAWYLPMTFAPHFLAALGLRPALVQVHCHPPVHLGDFESRKACAKHCEEQVRAGLQAAGIHVCS